MNMTGLASMTERMRDLSRAEYEDPLPVAEAFSHAMESPTPKRRHMVTPKQREANATVGAALRRQVELNHDQAHSVSAEELHKILDAVLAEQR